MRLIWPVAYIATIFLANWAISMNRSWLYAEWCMHCDATPHEPAGSKCHYPKWHIPNFNGTASEQTPEPAPAARLPYRDDDGRGE